MLHWHKLIIVVPTREAVDSCQAWILIIYPLPCVYSALIMKYIRSWAQLACACQRKYLQMSKLLLRRTELCLNWQLNRYFLIWLHIYIGIYSYTYTSIYKLIFHYFLCYNYHWNLSYFHIRTLNSFENTVIQHWKKIVQHLMVSCDSINICFRCLFLGVP